MTKKDDEYFQSFTKCWICDNGYADGDVKVRDNCQVTGKYRGSLIEIKVKLDHKILILFHNLKNYDPDLIMQEFGKFDFKINVMKNGLEEYMSFSLC